MTGKTEKWPVITGHQPLLGILGNMYFFHSLGVYMQHEIWLINNRSDLIQIGCMEYKKQLDLEEVGWGGC